MANPAERRPWKDAGMSTDPRSQLASSGAPRSAGANVEPQYFEFADMEPTVVTAAGGRQWWVRSQALVVAYVQLAPEEPLHIVGHPDEYMVIVPEGSAAMDLTAAGVTSHAPAGGLAVVPPGDSSLEAAEGATAVAVFSTQSAELAARCSNAAFYAQPDPNVAAWAAWPEGTGAGKVRVYDVAGVEPQDGRFGRLYRCSTLMVNWFYPDPGPRDPDKMSPHHHDDFEQISLQLDGDYVHHIRTPWTVDMAEWREDHHHHTTSPSVTVIPPPSIHTSQGVGDTNHQLIDIFAPPRVDFSSRPGWVLNADEYPALP